jgi:hypothetical protein
LSFSFSAQDNTQWAGAHGPKVPILKHHIERVE